MVAPKGFLDAEGTAVARVRSFLRERDEGEDYGGEGARVVDSRRSRAVPGAVSRDVRELQERLARFRAWLGAEESGVEPSEFLAALQERGRPARVVKRGSVPVHHSAANRCELPTGSVEE